MKELREFLNGKVLTNALVKNWSILSKVFPTGTTMSMKGITSSRELLMIASKSYEKLFPSGKGVSLSALSLETGHGLEFGLGKLSDNLLPSLKKKELEFTQETEYLLSLTSLAPFIPYMRYKEAQESTAHVYVSRKKREELEQLDIGADFRDIKIDDIIRLVPKNTMIFVDGVGALLLQPYNGSLFAEARSEKTVAFCWYPLQKVDEEYTVEGSVTVPYSSAYNMFNAVFFSFSKTIPVVRQAKDGMLEIEEEEGSSLAAFITEERKQDAVYENTLRQISPLLLKILLYINSSNIIKGKVFLDPTLSELSQKLEQAKGKKRKELAKKIAKRKASVRSEEKISFVDLSTSHVVSKEGAVSAINSTGERHVAQHVRAGHFTKYYVGSRSVPLEERPWVVHYIPAMIVGSKKVSIAKL